MIRASIWATSDRLSLVAMLQPMREQSVLVGAGDDRWRHRFDENPPYVGMSISRHRASAAAPKILAAKWKKDSDG